MSRPSFSPPPLSPTDGLRHIASLLNDCADIIEQRITTPSPPAWMSPAVSHWLLSLSDDDLRYCESNGISSYLNSTTTSAPSSLKHLAHRAAAINRLFPTLAPEEAHKHPRGQSRRRTKKRLRPTKRAQIESISRMTTHIIHASSKPIRRIVDVGAGHGHLASHLADELAPLHIPVMALDRDESLLATARQLHAPSGRTAASALSFVATDVGQCRIEAGEGDLLLGLHACGSLGDAIVHAASRQNVSAVVLVSCCLQKLSAPQQVRLPMSNIAQTDEDICKALQVHKNRLGITNRSRGYIAERDISSRETRYALRQLLGSHGVPVQRVGDEVHGISRHRLHKGLAEVGPDVLAVHGLEHVSLQPEDLQNRSEEAQIAYRRMRALTLPRALAGEILEMAIVLDRAAMLEESNRFRTVLTCRIWEDAISVRNLCCAAW